jgi:serine acetyltransferase
MCKHIFNIAEAPAEDVWQGINLLRIPVAHEPSFRKRRTRPVSPGRRGRSTPAMKPFVMFGVHPLFGDYVDAIHAAGGYLSRVVLNVQEPERPPGMSFREGIEKYHRWRINNGMPGRVDVLWLNDYRPKSGERPLLGFRGTKAGPLIKLLKEQHALTFPPLIHPTAYVSPMATIGEGVFIGANAVVASNADIGNFSLINRGATIGHDAILENSVVVGPSASTASWVRLCEGCVLGIACTVIERISIGAGAYVAAGAVVLNDVAPCCLVAGMPATVKKILQQGAVPR